jgi:Fic family protein
MSSAFIFAIFLTAITKQFFKRRDIEKVIKNRNLLVEVSPATKSRKIRELLKNGILEKSGGRYTITTKMLPLDKLLNIISILST